MTRPPSSRDPGDDASGHVAEPPEATNVVQFPERRRKQRFGRPAHRRPLTTLAQFEKALRCLHEIDNRVRRRLAGSLG